MSKQENFSPINIMGSCDSDSDSNSDSDSELDSDISTTVINDDLNPQSVKEEMKEITEAVSILAEAIANINESNKNGDSRILTQLNSLYVSLILENTKTFSVLITSLNRIEKNSKITNHKIYKTNQKLAKLNEKIDKLSDKLDKLTDSLIT